MGSAAAWVPRRERRQPRLLCPPASSRARLHLLRHPGREGNKGREQFPLFSMTFFRAVLPAQCCSPVTPAAAPRPPALGAVQMLLGTVGTWFPCRGACHPTLGAWSPLAQKRHSRQGYPAHHSSCPTPQHHRAFLRCSSMGIWQCWVNGLTPRSWRSFPTKRFYDDIQVPVTGQGTMPVVGKGQAQPRLRVKEITLITSVGLQGGTGASTEES